MFISILSYQEDIGKKRTGSRTSSYDDDFNARLFGAVDCHLFLWGWGDVSRKVYCKGLYNKMSLEFEPFLISCMCKLTTTNKEANKCSIVRRCLLANRGKTCTRRVPPRIYPTINAKNHRAFQASPATCKNPSTRLPALTAPPPPAGSYFAGVTGEK